jgi:hypothetical protein
MQEVVMQAFSEQAAVPEPTVDAATRWTAANRQALHFMLGAQRIIVEEMAFAVEAMLDRVRTETHLFGEFAAKVASSHSVQDWRAMSSECSQHQLEFARRDYDRLLRQGERLIETTSDLLSNPR